MSDLTEYITPPPAKAVVDGTAIPAWCPKCGSERTEASWKHGWLCRNCKASWNLEDESTHIQKDKSR